MSGERAFVATQFFLYSYTYTVQFLAVLSRTKHVRPPRRDGSRRRGFIVRNALSISISRPISRSRHLLHEVVRAAEPAVLGLAEDQRQRVQQTLHLRVG